MRALKRRVAGRIRGDRAGSPIEADQYRMYCEAGPVKIRLAARVVPDIVRGRWPVSTDSDALPGLPLVSSGALLFQSFIWSMCKQGCWNLSKLAISGRLIYG